MKIKVIRFDSKHYEDNIEITKTLLSYRKISFLLVTKHYLIYRN